MVELAAPEYHIVRNRHSEKFEASVSVEKNRTTLYDSTNKTAPVQIEKQLDRKTEGLSLHELRFESIDRDNKVLSKNKRTQSYVSLEKAKDRELGEKINYSTANLDYQINENLIKRKTPGVVSLDKQSRRWENDPYGSLNIKQQMIIQPNSGLSTHDSVKAF